MGQQAHGDDDDPSHVTARAEPDESEVGPAGATDEDGSAEPVAASPEASPRPGPGVPLRLLLLVTVVNVLLAVGLLTLRPPWRVERSAAPPPLPVQVAELQARVERGEQGRPYALVLTDDELTATARHFLALSEDVPFTQVRVGVVDGHVEATGVTTGLAVAVPVRVVANVEALNGAPVVSVMDVNIGGLALPAFARERVLTEANRAVDLSRYDLPVTVDAVAFRTGVLEVRGIVR
jgi:hypothetical protein